MKHTAEDDPPEPADHSGSPDTSSRDRGAEPQNPLLKFYRNPWVGIAATVCTVVSVPLGFYFFASSQRSREAVFYVHPQVSLIVKAGTPSQLKVLYRDSEVRTDVTAVQVSFWNNGREPIRPEHILAPVTLSTRQKTPILEATVRRTVRDVSDIRLDHSDLVNGVLRISWRILEQGDGALIQLILAGQSAHFVVEGVIEGQRGINVTQYYGGRAEPPPVFVTVPLARRSAGAFFLVVLIALGYWIISETRWEREEVRRRRELRTSREKLRNDILERMQKYPQLYPERILAEDAPGELEKPTVGSVTLEISDIAVKVIVVLTTVAALCVLVYLEFTAVSPPFQQLPL